MKHLIKYSLASLILFSQVTFADGHIVNACSKAVHNYAVNRDALNVDAANSFAEDGVLITPKKTYAGREQLRAYISAWPKEIKTVHHITTEQITAISKTEAQGKIYSRVEFYKAADSGVSSVFRHVNLIYNDSYKIADGSCVIAERSFTILTDSGATTKPDDKPAK